MKQRGFKLTKPRVVILDFILKAHGHLTAETVYQKLKSRKLGRSTVFRTFKIFEELGLIEKKPSDIVKEYELREKPRHFHIICTKCGKVLEFTQSRITDICKTKAKKEKFKMSALYLEIFGLCRNCRNRD